MLIQGKSGAGKNHAFTHHCGALEPCRGEINCPTHNQLFLSQKPYVPQGNLMSALAYPNNADNISHTQAVEILNKVQLGHLAEQLEKRTRLDTYSFSWRTTAFGVCTINLHKPAVAFFR